MQAFVGLNPATHSTAFGKLAELRLAVDLFDRGHKVAAPLVDDDGVDLIVDYRVTVQVKSRSGHSLETAPGYRYNAVVVNGPFLTDVLALVVGERRFFFPREELPLSSLSLYLSATRGRSFRLLAFEDRWDVFSR